MYDLDDREAAALGAIAARVMRAQRAALGAEHVYAFAIGDVLHHCHLHLVPRYADTPQRLRGRGCFDSRREDALPAWRIVAAAETLRRALDLSAAEIWRDAGDGLERAVSDPERGPDALSLTAAQRPVVAREGIAGEGFLNVWLPGLLERRPPSLLRVAPIVHAGELLGLIVAERPPDGRPFSEREEQMLGALARQIGAALHNVRLDSALQATLDELRRQADELRADGAPPGGARRRELRLGAGGRRARRARRRAPGGAGRAARAVPGHLSPVALG
jgi:GAF domain-containing protein